MKITAKITHLTLGLALISTVGWAQTTPTGTATSTTYPTGAVAPDSGKTSGNQRRSAKMTRADRRAMRQNAKRGADGTTSNQQEGQYRQSSAANGTAVNNSNSDNYNSNNVTNAPTGVGSNPSVTTNPTTLSGTATTGSSAASSGSSGSNTTSTTTSEPKTGTARAVTAAPTTATPANVAGSTERNTNIHDFIASSPNYITLQNALQSADLYNLLKENEVYTLFAPLNTAFKKLPASMQAGLLEGRNRDALKQLLSYHLVRGSLDANELSGRIKAGSGKVQLQTLAGGMLTAQMGANGRIMITDEQGKSVTVESTQKVQSNGVVHGIDSVLMPKSGASSIR